MTGLLRLTTLLLCAVFGSTSIYADTVSTERVLEAPSKDEAAPVPERDRVQQFLERADVRKQLQAMGVAPDIAGRRVQSLTDEEVHSLAARIDKLPAGGDIGKNTLILILIILLIAVLI